MRKKTLGQLKKSLQVFRNKKKMAWVGVQRTFYWQCNCCKILFDYINCLLMGS